MKLKTSVKLRVIQIKHWRGNEKRKEWGGEISILNYLDIIKMRYGTRFQKPFVSEQIDT